jgi:hypothetical protein
MSHEPFARLLHLAARIDAAIEFMKWPEGFRMPAHLPTALDPRGDIMADYLHPDEVRSNADNVQAHLRSMRDLDRATTGGVIRERLGQRESAHGVLREPAQPRARDRAPLEKLALRHEIAHAIHEQRHGQPQNIGQIARSEWAAQAGSLLNESGRQFGGSLPARFGRAVVGAAKPTLRQMRR